MSGAWFFIMGVVIGGLAVFLFFRNGDNAVQLPESKPEPKPETEPETEA